MVLNYSEMANLGFLMDCNTRLDIFVKSNKILSFSSPFYYQKHYEYRKKTAFKHIFLDISTFQKAKTFKHLEAVGHQIVLKLCFEFVFANVGGCKNNWYLRAFKIKTENATVES